MKKMFYTLLPILLCVLFLPYISNADESQDAAIRKSVKDKYPDLMGSNNVGKDFWISVPPVFYNESGGCANFIKLYITSPYSTLVKVEVPGRGYMKSATTIANDVIDFSIDPGIGQPFVKDGYTAAPNEHQIYTGKGIHITSADPIVCYTVCRYCYTSDGFLAIPTSALGKEYIAAPYQEDPMFSSVWGYHLPGMIAITAAYDQTQVSFTLGGNVNTVTPAGLKPGLSTKFSLNQGDVVLVCTSGPSGDLCGSKIIATKPVAVISGNQCTNIPVGNQWCDYTVEEDLPDYTWGKTCFVPTVPGRAYSPYIRVIAKEANTTLYRNGSQIGTLATSGGVINKGWFEMRLVPEDWGNMPACISGDKPITVVVCEPGAQEDMGTYGTYHDPFTMDITPLEQYQKSITFCMPGTTGGMQFQTNWFALVYPVDKNDGMPDDIMFGTVTTGYTNWVQMKSKFTGEDYEYTQKINGQAYKVKLTKDLPPVGVFSIKGSEPFAAYSFGFGNCDSYGYPTSAALTDLTKPDTVVPDPTWILNCDGSIDNGVINDLPNDASIRSNLSMIYMDKDSTYNYNFTYVDFVPGDDRKTTWTASVVDPNKPARLVVTFSDRAGNDTTIVIYYKPILIELHPDYYDFGLLKLGETKTEPFWVVNGSDANVEIKYLNFKFGNVGFTMDTIAPFWIAPYDSIKVNITFTATVSGVFSDSIHVEDTCYHFANAYVQAAVGEPIIRVTDIDFHDVSVGTDAPPQPCNISNEGTVPLYIPSYTKLTQTAFSIDKTLDNSITAGGGKITLLQNSVAYKFMVNFKPDHVGDYLDSIVFSSDAVTIDSICYIKGRGIQASLVASSLDWLKKRITRPAFPIPAYTFDKDGNTAIILINSGTQDVHITGLEVVSSDLNGIDNPAFIFDRTHFDNLTILHGESDTVLVSFLPDVVGDHSLVFQYTNSAKSDTKTTLQGTGILPRISTSNYEFGSTVVNDYISAPATQTVVFKNEPYPYQDSLTITDLLIAPVGTINDGGKVTGLASDYGTLGYMYDRAKLGLPVTLQPNQTLSIPAYFVATQVDTAKSYLTAVSDAETPNVTSNWTGEGISLGIASMGATETVCYGTPVTMDLVIKNTKLGKITIDSVLVDYSSAPDFQIYPADVKYLNNSFDIEPNHNDTIRFIFTGNKNNPQQTLRVSIYNTTLDSPIIYQTLIGNSVYFSRTTTLSIDNKKTTIPNIFNAKLTINKATDTTSMKIANLNKILVTIKYSSGILRVDDANLTVYNSSKFMVIPNTPDYANGVFSFYFKTVNGEPIDNLESFDIVSIPFRSFLPKGTDSSDIGHVFASYSTLDADNNSNVCIDIDTSGDYVQLVGTCDYNIRRIIVNPTEYYFNEVAPNPVNKNGSKFNFGLGLEAYTELSIYNSMGELVAKPVDGVCQTGVYDNITIPYESLPSGVYTCVLKSGPYTKTQKLVITK